MLRTFGHLPLSKGVVLNASQEMLQRYGVPPKPEQAKDAKLFEVWKRAVTSGKRNIQPILEETKIYHKPVELTLALPKMATAVKNPVARNSSNWSGLTIYDPNKPFATSFVLGYWTVPLAQQAFGQSTGNWDYSSQWVGIDGFGGNDVMQAGTEVDAYPAGSTNYQFYSFWIEWFPYAESRISNFPAGPGDTVFVEVWNTSPTNAYAFLLNLNTNQSVSLNFTAPSGTTLQGNSAEWVVERPSIGGSLATLTNYVADAFSFCAAAGFNRQVYYYPGTDFTPTGTVYKITMLDNGSNPISFPNITGTESIWFFDEGSAR